MVSVPESMASFKGKKKKVGNVTNKDVKHALVIFVGSPVLFLLPCTTFSVILI